VLRERCLSLEIQVLEALHSSVGEEYLQMDGFDQRKGEYEETTRLLRRSLVTQRRQRAVQTEMNDRNETLKDLRCGEISSYIHMYIYVCIYIYVHI
jgi:hypothetical protein